jgi:hypothetical protein
MDLTPPTRRREGLAVQGFEHVALGDVEALLGDLTDLHLDGLATGSCRGVEDPVQPFAGHVVGGMFEPVRVDLTDAVVVHQPEGQQQQSAVARGEHVLGELA